MTENKFSENRKTARIAGVWYLAFVIFGVLGMIYADGDIGAAKLIFSNELLFRFGLISCFAGYVCFLLLASNLYKLFKSINSSLSRLMLLFVIVGVAIAFLNRLNQIAAFLFFHKNNY
ncbi:MAG: DUF4386 domain-containing protein, partial [Bacteroidales bacterium]|nr:DUF4386 domain-containing protein [Bacteroidales bacterium]